MPDENARRLLLTRYSRRLPFTAAALDDAAARADGMTASFIKELVRRGVLIASEAGRDATDDDLVQSLREMLSEAQSITRSLLGAFEADLG